MENKGLLEGGAHGKDDYKSVEVIGDVSSVEDGGIRFESNGDVESASKNGDGEKSNLLSSSSSSSSSESCEQSLSTQQEGDIFAQAGQKEHATFKGAVFNLSNATIGSGVLGLPFVLREIGLVLGLAFVVFFAFLSDYSIQLLHQCSEILIKKKSQAFIKARNYESIAEILYGKIGGNVVKLCVIMGTFGAMLSYMIIIGDLLTSSFLQRIEKSVEDDGLEYFWLERPFVVGMVALFVLFPMSITERMATLFLPSLISLLSILAFMIIVVFYYFFGEVDRKGDIILAQVNMSFFKVLPVIIFAYSCHTKLLPIAKDFTHNSGKLGDAVHCSVFICFAAYAMIGSFGYLSFYNNTKGDLVLSYTSKDYFIDTIKLIMAISIITTVPIVAYPCRLSLDNLIFPSKEVAPHRYMQFALNYPRARSIVEVAVILTCAYALSIGLPSVTVVFSLTGSTVSTLNSFIFPSLFYIKLSDWQYWWEPKVLGAGTLLISAAIFGVLATTITFTGLFVDLK